MLQIEIEKVKKNLHNIQAHYSATTGPLDLLSPKQDRLVRPGLLSARRKVMMHLSQWLSITEWKNIMLMELYSGQSEHSSPLAPTGIDAGIGQSSSREGRRQMA